MSYLITRLSPEAQSFLTRLISSGKSRERVATIAIARTISSYFSLPSAPVENPEEEYMMQCQILASRIISDLNELVPVDVKALTDMTRAFYMHRYVNAHPEKAVFAFDPESGLADFFNLSKNFSKETLAVITSEASIISSYCNGLRSIIRDLRAFEEAQAKSQGA